MDPWFLVEYAREESRLIRQAREVNEARPRTVAGEILSICERNGVKRVSVLGVTYKQDVDDTRESPSTAVIADLKAHLGDNNVRVHDPLVDSNAYHYPIDTLFNAITDSELVVFLVAHREFNLIDPRALMEIMKKRIVVDYMQSIDSTKWKAAGFKVFTMGHTEMVRFG